MTLALPPELTCRDVVELVTRYDEDALAPADRAVFEAHLAACDACVLYYQQLRQTRTLARALDDARAPDDAPLDPAIERALLDAFPPRS